MNDKSRKQERRLAKEIGGHTTPASGAFWSRKGDVRSDRYLVEAKRTDKASISIKADVWDKIRREAIIDGRIPVLALQIGSVDLAVLDWEDFLALDSREDLGEGGVP